MTSHDDVAQRITSGSQEDRQKSLKGTNMQYVPASQDNPEMILGYDWAVYAVRIDDTVIIDWAWYSYSMSTKKHIGIIESRARSRWSDVNIAYVHGFFRGQNTKVRRSSTEDLVEKLKWDREELKELGPVNARPEVKTETS